MEKIKRNNGFIELHTDNDHYLHMIDSTSYLEIRHIMIKEQDVDKYEEVLVSDVENIKLNLEKDTNYSIRVKELISQKYSLEDEIALINNKDEDEEHYAEYTAYMNYRKECKLKAKKEIYG